MSEEFKCGKSECRQIAIPKMKIRDWKWSPPPPPPPPQTQKCANIRTLWDNRETNNTLIYLNKCPSYCSIYAGSFLQSVYLHRKHHPPTECVKSSIQERDPCGGMISSGSPYKRRFQFADNYLTRKPVNQGKFSPRNLLTSSCRGTVTVFATHHYLPCSTHPLVRLCIPNRVLKR